VIFAGILLTYPASLIGIAIGRIPNPTTPIATANGIAREQLFFAYFAFMIAVPACFCVLFLWMLGIYVLMMLGIMDPIDSLFSPSLLVVMAMVHVVSQCKAWLEAVRSTSMETLNRHSR
jgi:hypothetical protein